MLEVTPCPASTMHCMRVMCKAELRSSETLASVSSDKSYLTSQSLKYCVDPLAYLTAKTNGFDDLAAEILEAAGLTDADVDDVPTFAVSTLRPPSVITPTSDLLWPSISTGESFFDRALANGQLEGGVDPLLTNGDAAGAHSALDAWAKEEQVQDDIDPEEGGWELDVDGGEFHGVAEGDNSAAAGDAEEDLGAGATPGPSETDLWVRNSPLAVDHVAAGSFETAMQVGFHITLINIVTGRIQNIFI